MRYLALQTKRSFTLVEVVVVVVILGILVTLAIPRYQNFMEDSKYRVCITNQEVLLKAVEAFALENDQAPTSLSQIPQEQIKLAWQAVTKNRDLQTRLAYFVVDWDARGFAYAQNWIGNYAGNVQLLLCPKDVDGYPSYGINPALFPVGVPLNYTQLKSFAGVVIFDSDNSRTTLSRRHRSFNMVGAATDYAAGVAISGDKYECRYNQLNYCQVP